MTAVRKVLLFDIDGTLLLTGGAGLVAFERAFEECFGIADSWGGVFPDGKTDPIIFSEIAKTHLQRDLESHEYDDLCRRYLRYFAEAIHASERFRLMPGVTELLGILEPRKDLLLGVATGNLEPAAWDKLRKGNLEKYFKFGGYGSDAARRDLLVKAAMDRAQQISKTPLSPSDYIVIGDTPLDIRAAKANGAQVVAVATGSYSLTDLTQYGADLVLTDLSDPQPLLNYLA